MAEKTTYTSFLVRIWRDNQAGETQREPACRGEVHHIQSDRTRHFNDMGALLRYIEDHTHLDAACSNSKP